MPTEPVEVTFKAFIGSIWFKGLYRSAMTVGGIMITLAVPVWWWIGGSASQRVTTVEASVATIQTDRATRINLTDMRLKAIDANINDLQLDVAAVKADTQATKLDIATMKGILQEIQRHTVADVIPLHGQPTTVARR